MSALVIRGRIVTMENGADTGVVAGRAWVRDDAIVAVTEGDSPLDGFD